MENHTDVKARAGDAAIEQPGFATRRRDQAGKQFEQRALAAAGGSDDAEKFASRDIELDLLERDDRAAFHRVVGLGERQAPNGLAAASDAEGVRF